MSRKILAPLRRRSSHNRDWFDVSGRIMLRIAVQPTARSAFREPMRGRARMPRSESSRRKPMVSRKPRKKRLAGRVTFSGTAPMSMTNLPPSEVALRPTPAQKKTSSRARYNVEPVCQERQIALDRQVPTSSRDCTRSLGKSWKHPRRPL